MDLPRDVETTNHSLEIPITMDALQKKLFAAQGSQLHLYEQYMSSVSRLKEKDQVINLVRSEASINAQALKKLAEEDQILRGAYDDLVNQCKDLLVIPGRREELVRYRRSLLKPMDATAALADLDSVTCRTGSANGELMHVHV